MGPKLRYPAEDQTGTRAHCDRACSPHAIPISRAEMPRPTISCDVNVCCEDVAVNQASVEPTTAMFASSKPVPNDPYTSTHAHCDTRAEHMQAHRIGAV